MDLFDSSGNKVGEIFGDTFQWAASATSESFGQAANSVSGSDSLGEAIVTILLAIVVAWPASLIVIAIICVLRLIFVLLLQIMVIGCRILWWFLRMPFTLIFYRELPRF